MTFYSQPFPKALYNNNLFNWKQSRCSPVRLPHFRRIGIAWTRPHPLDLLRALRLLGLFPRRQIDNLDKWDMFLLLCRRLVCLVLCCQFSMDSYRSLACRDFSSTHRTLCVVHAIPISHHMSPAEQHCQPPIRLLWMSIPCRRVEFPRALCSKLPVAAMHFHRPIQSVMPIGRIAFCHFRRLNSSAIQIGIPCRTINHFRANRSRTADMLSTLAPQIAGKVHCAQRNLSRNWLQPSRRCSGGAKHRPNLGRSHVLPVL